VLSRVKIVESECANIEVNEGIVYAKLGRRTAILYTVSYN